MPLYEYLCDACGHRFETIQRCSDPPIATCPKCGGPVHKLMSSPAIQFKGSGWYITDYPKKDSAAAGKASDGKDEGSGGSGKDAAAKTKEGGTTSESTSPSASGTSSGESSGGDKPASTPAKSKD